MKIDARKMAIMNPKKAVEGCLIDIGKERKTWGGLKTEIEGNLLKILPICLLRRYVMPISSD
jgi:hypothetical protein